MGGTFPNEDLAGHGNSQGDALHGLLAFHQMAPYGKGLLADILHVHGHAGDGGPVVPADRHVAKGRHKQIIWDGYALLFEIVHQVNSNGVIWA